MLDRSRIAVQAAAWVARHGTCELPWPTRVIKNAWTLFAKTWPIYFRRKSAVSAWHVSNHGILSSRWMCAGRSMPAVSAIPCMKRPCRASPIWSSKGAGSWSLSMAAFGTGIAAPLAMSPSRTAVFGNQRLRPTAPATRVTSSVCALWVGRLSMYGSAPCKPKHAHGTVLTSSRQGSARWRLARHHRTTSTGIYFPRPCQRG